MSKKLGAGGVMLTLAGLLPSCVWAAGAEPATDLIVVADTRALQGLSLYLATVYNEDIWLFAIWAVVLTTALGVGLGVLMDLIMTRVGLDLGKRSSHVEH